LPLPGPWSENQAVIERILGEINRVKGIFVLFATHDLDQAARLSLEVVSLFEGRLVRSRFQNILRGRIVARGRGRRYCILADGSRLSLDTERQGSVRLAVDPERAVLLLKGQAPGRNTLSGRVTQLTEERGQVRVRVDVGFPMAVLVSSAGADALRVGQRVRVHIPPEALSVL